MYPYLIKPVGRCVDLYGAYDSILRQIVQKGICHIW